MSESSSPEIQINIKGPSELKLQISISTDKTVLELKQAIAEKSDVEADRQRLIYSGRVLKDEDLLSVYKIQSSHTIHMVKGVSRSGGASTSQAAPPPQLPTMQAGQVPTDPLTVLNGPMGHGVMAGFNPFAQMGLNANDPNMFQGMLDNPQFLQQMSTMMSDPAVLDQILASNPQLQAMGPQMRQIFQSDQFRNMMSNPQALRSMLQMSSMMQGSGAPNAFGGAGNFPAPGLPSYAASNPNIANTSTPQQQQQPQSPPPFPLFNPFMFGMPPAATPGAAPTSPGSAPTNSIPFIPPSTTDSTSTQPNPNANAIANAANPGANANANGAPNPFAALSQLLGASAATNPYGTMDPSMMQSLFGGGVNPFGGFGGAGAGAGGAPATPADTRPPEERYESQLGQLQGMGFTNASQNIRALMATGGNVNAAVEYILSGNGL